MKSNNVTINQGRESVLATNGVLRNTYLLLSLTLLFSALTAGIAMATNAAIINPFVYILVFFGLFFVTARTSNSAWGLVSVFALTGFMGYYLGPILNLFIHGFSNGSEIVMTALAGTGLTFLGLSAYTIISRKDMSFLNGFIFVGCWVLLIAVIASLFLHIPALNLAISGAFVVFSSLLIMWETSRIIHGGERNYILATVSLYISIYNLFLSLLNILGALNGRN
ncbi:MAG: BAX inhibitor protein [Legionellales bacterium]|nr:BAX inhibitor protein [Legionellales bacterium]|tara:strand:- start:823 stop:1494 length:672 start_codon:yes stop_codon:yes gene_type:complete